MHAGDAPVSKKPKIDSGKLLQDEDIVIEDDDELLLPDSSTMTEKLAVEEAPAVAAAGAPGAMRRPKKMVGE